MAHNNLKENYFPLITFSTTTMLVYIMYNIIYLKEGFKMDHINLLHNHNLKVTPQRLEIVDILFKHGHLNIDDMFSSLQKKFPTLSLATIYKNINTMVTKNFLIEVKIPNQKNVYELTKQEHSHVVCSKCNSIMDIDLDTTNILKQAKSISNYNLDTSSIILNGLCPNCQS